MNGARDAKENELRDKCFEEGLGERETNIAVDYFIRRLSHKEISEKYNITEQSSGNKKHKLKKKLKID